MTVAIDACVLIAHFDESDAHHDDATRLLASLSGQRLLVHPLTAAEVLVGSARLGRARERRESIRSMRVETAAVDDGAPMRLAELRAHTRHRMPDCCVLDVALHHGGLLATFDEPLRATARKLHLDTLPR